MQEKFFSNNLDFIGFSASVLCAIHCISLPLLLSVGALSGLAWLENEIIELLLIVVSFVIASWSLGQSYIKQHRKFDAIFIVLIGFGLIILAHTITHNHVLMMLGGLIIAIAHFQNWRMLNHSKKLELAK